MKEEATAVEYLKTLAISRIYLDNIVNIQSSWVTPGLKTCQVGLRFGGNDVGSIMIEENVVSAAGTHHHATEEELRRMIRDAGFVPKQRDTLYRTIPELGMKKISPVVAFLATCALLSLALAAGASSDCCYERTRHARRPGDAATPAPPVHPRRREPPVRPEQRSRSNAIPRPGAVPADAAGRDHPLPPCRLPAVRPPRGMGGGRAVDRRVPRLVPPPGRLSIKTRATSNSATGCAG